MYKLSLAIVIILLVGCKEEYKPPIAYKEEYKAVHNTCDNVWAFRCRKTELGQSVDYYLGTYYGMHISDSGPREDTCVCMGLGDELTFKDSISAVLAYERYDKRVKDAIKADWEFQRKQDSINKCHHSYE